MIKSSFGETSTPNKHGTSAKLGFCVGWVLVLLLSDTSF